MCRECCQSWLVNCFNNRKIDIRVGRYCSDEVQISEGSLQSAVLSPLLYDLMLSDSQIAIMLQT